MAAEFFTDTRMGRNTRHGLVAQLRQSIYSRLAGYEYTSDAEQLCNDPAMRCLVGGGAARHPAASTSQMGRFETDVLTQRQPLVIAHPANQVDQDRREIVRHARYTFFQMAEVSVPQHIFAAILRRIRRLMQPVPV